MRVNSKYLIEFIAEQLQGFKLKYSQTAPVGADGQYRLRISGMINKQKVLVFSSYTPNQLKAELENGYKLILKKETGYYLIDLKRT
jgi:hypothetical protein